MNPTKNRRNEPSKKIGDDDMNRIDITYTQTLKEIWNANEENGARLLNLTYNNGELLVNLSNGSTKIIYYEKFECSLETYAILLTKIINDPFFDAWENGEAKVAVECGGYR